MRDPNRIPMVLAAVGRAWTEHPDQRLGQLLYNALNGRWDVFDVEDDRLLTALATYGGIDLSEEQAAFVEAEPEKRHQGWRKFIQDAEAYFGFR